MMWRWRGLSVTSARLVVLTPREETTVQEPTTVELQDSNGVLYNFNVGVAIKRSFGTVFRIGDNSLTVDRKLSDSELSKVMQLFSDLLTDAGV